MMTNKVIFARRLSCNLMMTHTGKSQVKKSVVMLMAVRTERQHDRVDSTSPKSALI